MMTHLFLGVQEIMLLLLSTIVPMVIAVLFLYVVYRMVDRWVNKSIETRREQNELLATLIEKTGKGRKVYPKKH